MEGSISCVAFIFTTLIVLTSAIQDQLFCCGNGFIALKMSSRRCEIDQHLWLPCDEISSVPYLEVDRTNFTLKDDGRYYFKVNKFQSEPLSPFCLARTVINETIDRNLSVIFCRNEIRIADRQLQNQFHQEIIDNLEDKNVEISLSTIACIISGALLAVVAVLYIGLPVTKDIEERMIFHVALNQSLFYLGCACASVVLTTGFVEPHLGNYCVFFWYLFVFVELNSFMWCAILTYHLRRTFRSNQKFNELKHYLRYVIVAYGIPALLVVLCNIHVLTNTLLYGDILERACNNQFDLMTSYYGFMPLIIISLVNIYLFVSLRRHVKNGPPSSSEFSVTSMERFTFRLSLNKKLFILLVLPWLVIAFLGLPMGEFKSRLVNHKALANCVENLTHGIYILLCSEGIIMFYMLIVGHRNL